MTENEIAAMVVDASLCVHRTLGPGLFESVYQAALNYELKNRGLVVFQQLGVPVHGSRRDPRVVVLQEAPHASDRDDVGGHLG